MKSLPGLLLATGALLVALAACGSGGDTTTTPDSFDTAVDVAPEAIDATELPDIVKDQDAGCPGECCADGECDDHDACTVDRCEANACVHAPATCDDANACTTDSCDPVTGCHHASIAGCCLEGAIDTLLDLRFDEGLDGVTVETFGASSPTPATWQPSTLKYHSAAQSLYFGIPSAGSYDNGKRVAARLVTPIVALPGNRLAEVSFWVWFDVDADDATDLFAVSALSGGERLPLFQKRADLIDRAWHQITLDLTALASRDVTLEFAFDSVTGEANDFNGVYVDDVVVTSICTPPSCTADGLAGRSPGEGGCDDGLACTTGSCGAGLCAFEPITACCLSRLDCRDADACTRDLCDAGACRWEAVTGPGCCNSDADCDDDDPCTTNTCVDDVCRSTPSGVAGCCETDADCDDGDACTTDACVDKGCVLLNACCTLDADCDDGDATCTADFCVEGACVYQPTGVAGCCLSEIVGLAFDDGALGGLVLENSDPAVGWHVFGAAGTSSSPTPALYYGDSSDPTHLTYDAGNANWGTASLPVQLVPAGSSITLTFDAWLDTEASPDFDTLTFSLQVGDNHYLLWDKKQLVTTLAWHTYQVDLSAFAGLEGTLHVRFDTVDDTVNTGEGVYLDNLEIATSCTVRACQVDDDCDDGLAATEARCLPNGQCSYELKNEPCAYGFECDDQDPCTADGCEAGFCEHLALAACCKAAIDCDDANDCTVDTCDATNACRYAWTPGCCLGEADCDDADPCTADQCPVAGQACTHAAIEGCCTLNLDCDDGLPGTDDACTRTGCVHRPIACATTIDCADGDACTADACLAGTCTWLPVESPGCCQPLLLDVTFDDGTAGPFSLVSSAHDVRWQLSSARANSTPFALYYGDPAAGTYDNGAANSGRVVSDTVFLPANTLLTFSFATWLDIETALTQDPLTVTLHTDLGPVVVWTKADLVGPALTWTQQQVDLTPYAGQAVQIEVAFDTKDPWANTGEGLYLDDLRLVSSCAPAPCLSDGDCASFDACAPASCVQGLCLTAPTAGCCAANAECDDGNACTQDTCPQVGGTCVHAWKEHCCLAVADCDDANPCTVDGCTNQGGICTHDWTDGCCLTNAECEDHQGGTLDLCVQSACAHLPAGCATAADCDDGDACTSATCLAGACAYLPVATPQCCTPTLLEAAFDQGSALPFALTPDGWHVSEARYGDSAPASLYFGHESGLEGCDDGFGATTHDFWTGEGCRGLVSVPPVLFRVSALGLAEPAAAIDLGAGPAPVNELLGAHLTAHLPDLAGGALVAAFDPLAFGFGDARLLLGAGTCGLSGDQPQACRFTTGGDSVRFEAVQLAADGACAGLATDQPCFASALAPVALTDVVPGLLPGGTPVVVQTKASGTFAGSPLDSLAGASLRAFVPVAVLDTVVFDAAVLGRQVRATEILDPEALTQVDGVAGWWLRFSLTAERVPLLPVGCTATPEGCDDADACTLDRCDVTTGACVHGAAPDGAACDDGDATSVNDACDAGACRGVPLAPPAVYRLDTLELRSPELVYDFGGGAAPINELLNAILTARLSEMEFGGMIAVFDQLQDPDAATVSIGEGLCTFADGVPLACGLTPLGRHAELVGVTASEVGGCHDEPYVAAPCFQTASQAFDLGGLIPELFSGAQWVNGRAFGSFVGGPDAGSIEQGVVEGFVPRNLAAQLAFTLGETTITGDALLAGVPLEIQNGVEGWTVQVRFTANRVQHVAAPGTCGAEPALCDDHDPATADLCREGPATCLNLERPSQPPAGSLLDERPRAGSAISAPITLPPSAEARLSFSLFLDVEPGVERDPLLVRVLGAHGPLTVWDKMHLGPADYRRWLRQEVDLTGFQGQSVRLELRFDTVDTLANDGEGVYVDDVRVETTCAPRACETDAVCSTPEPCRAAACVDGMCLTAAVPECCVTTADCNDANACTVDACADGTCSHEATPGCCSVDADCDDGAPCTIDTCTAGNLCAHTYDAECTAPLPYLQPFAGVSALAPLGWTTRNQAGGPGTNWKIATSGGGFDTHLMFDDTPVVQNYTHRAVSPRLSAPTGTPITLLWQAAFEAYTAATTETTCKVEISADDGATWKTAWSATYKKTGAAAAPFVADVTADLAGSTQARVAFTVSGATSYDILGWHVDDVRVLTGLPPVVDVIGDKTAMVGDVTEILFTASDPEGQSVSARLLEPEADWIHLEARAGGLFALVVEPTVEEIGDHAVRLVASDGQFDVARDFVLTVTSSRILLAENFDTADTLPGLGWSASIDAGTVPHWGLAPAGGINGSPAAEFDWYPAVTNFSETLISPVFDASTAGSDPVQLVFSHRLDLSSAFQGTLTAKISNDDGVTWAPAWTLAIDGSSDLGPDTVVVPVSELLAAAPKARLAFTLAGKASSALRTWQLDTVRVLRGSVPEFTPVAPQKAYIGKTRDIVLHASDADGDGLTFELMTPLPFLTIEALGPNAALLRAKPGVDDWGTHAVGVVVTDGLFSTRLEFPLTVQNEGETVLLHETFDDLDSLEDGGWSIALGANLASDTHWRLVATSDLGDSGAAQFYWSPGVYAYDESLVSPLIDATAINGQGAQVGFSHVLDVYSATTLTLALLVSTDGGQSWSEAWTHDSFDADGPVDVGPESVLVDLTPWLPGAADARIAFRIAGDDTYALNGWYVDDVLLLGLANP